MSLVHVEGTSKTLTGTPFDHGRRVHPKNRVEPDENNTENTFSTFSRAFNQNL